MCLRSDKTGARSRARGGCRACPGSDDEAVPSESSRWSGEEPRFESGVGGAGAHHETGGTASRSVAPRLSHKRGIEIRTRSGRSLVVSLLAAVRKSRRLRSGSCCALSEDRPGYAALFAKHLVTAGSRSAPLVSDSTRLIRSASRRRALLECRKRALDLRHRPSRTRRSTAVIRHLYSSSVFFPISLSRAWLSMLGANCARVLNGIIDAFEAAPLTASSRGQCSWIATATCTRSGRTPSATA